jgi:hypothetical protein
MVNLDAAALARQTTETDLFGNEEEQTNDSDNS